MLAILVDVRWCHNHSVVLIYISLMTNTAEYPFICFTSRSDLLFAKCILKYSGIE